MVRDICKDKQILGTVSQEATKEDLSVAEDLLDTLQANSVYLRVYSKSPVTLGGNRILKRYGTLFIL